MLLSGGQAASETKEAVLIEKLQRAIRPLVLLPLLVIAMVWGPAVADAADITLSWTAPGDDGNVGTAAQYDLRYSTSPITDANWQGATTVAGLPAPSPAGSDESVTVTGLNANTTYYFAIKTADEADNWSALSNVASVTTADEIPPAAIADLSAQIEP